MGAILGPNAFSSSQPSRSNAIASRPTLHASRLDTTTGILDLEGYVPKKAIIDTGASKVMVSSSFAAAIGIVVDTLAPGPPFITAIGKMEEPVGVTLTLVTFTLGRGTQQIMQAYLPVTVVETNAYDVLLGINFLKAIRGSYDSYTEMFLY